MVPTHGLTHIALAVVDPERSARFYSRILGAKTVYSGPDFVQIQTPGTYDVLVFERDPARAGRAGGVVHFGFRLQAAEDIARALRTVRNNGGVVVDHGEFVPGEPYLFARDPVGYTFELWFELPTPIDPPAPRRRRNDLRPGNTAPKRPA
jgi:catechol 2,3-dioxygenase-like lactoylglutathione lyase family enzyme